MHRFKQSIFYVVFFLGGGLSLQTFMLGWCHHPLLIFHLLQNLHSVH